MIVLPVPVNAFEFIGRVAVVEGIEYGAGNLPHRDVLIAHTRKARLRPSRPSSTQGLRTCSPVVRSTSTRSATSLSPLAQPFLAGFSSSIRSAALQWTAKRFFTSCVENFGD